MKPSQWFILFLTCIVLYGGCKCLDLYYKNKRQEELIKLYNEVLDEVQKHNLESMKLVIPGDKQ